MQEDLRVPFCRREPQEPEAKPACFPSLPCSGARGTSLVAVQFGSYSGELTGSVGEEVEVFCDPVVASKCCRITSVFFVISW